MENQDALYLHGVAKSFKKTTILRDVHLQVSKGEVVGIVGSNGSGKTTLLRMVMGLIYPDSGEVTVMGHKIVPGLLGNLPHKIGALIEHPLFLPQFSGFQNLSLLASIRNELGHDDIKAVLAEVGLDPTDRKIVNKYSLGMRQRLGIAQAIMEHPDVVLFDEPTNGLDVDGVDLFTNIVKKMTAQGTSFVIVSHRKEDIETLCDTVYKISDGSLTRMEETVRS